MADASIPQQKTCKKCGSSKSLAEFTPQKLGKLGRTAECKACLRIRNQEYRRLHPAKIKEFSRRYYHSNKPKMQARRALWNQENPSKRKIQSQRYYYKNREAILKRNKPYIAAFYKARPDLRFMAKQRRRQAEALAVGAFTFQQWAAKCAYWGWRCYLCSRSLTSATVTLDHRIPLSRGGSCWLANLAPACRTCNESKGRKTDREYKRFRQEVVMVFSQ